MPVAWDTTLVSRLRPGTLALATFLGLIESDESPLIPAIALGEVAFGLGRLGEREQRELVVWLRRLVRRPGVRVLSFSTQAALASGRVRARAPFPLTRRRYDRRSKAERRVSWAHDIAIAATAWGVGVPVATENIDDFVRIGDLLAEVYPRAIRLEVRPSPL